MISARFRVQCDKCGNWSSIPRDTAVSARRQAEASDGFRFTDNHDMCRMCGGAE